MLMKPDQAVLLAVDIQSRLLPAVVDAEGMLARSQWLLRVAEDLALPTVISEQYPSGLGPTHADLLAAAPSAQVVEKRHFSCVAAACLPQPLMEARSQVVVFGMETHVCVLQTVMELLEQGKQVFVVADAVASRTLSDQELGLQRVRDAGAVLVSREMMLFEMLHTSEHSRFRYFSQTYLR